MATNIRKGARVHLYITEWFDAKDLNDEKVGNRLGVDRATVFRWRKEQNRLNPAKIAALASALEIEPEDFWRPPPPPDAPPSLDKLVEGAPDNIRAMAVDIVRRMAGKAG